MLVEKVGWTEEKLVFAGISMGGAVTQAYCLAHPSNVDRIVLVAAAGLSEPWFR